MRWPLAVLLLAACPPGEGAIYLTVDAAPGTAVMAVDRLRVTAILNGQRSNATEIPLEVRPGSFPPARSFQLRFDRERSGTISIEVAALDSTAVVLASGSVATQLSPGRETGLQVLLAGQVISDGGDDDQGMPDLASPADQMASSDLQSDLQPPPDLESPADLPGCLATPTWVGDAGTVLYVRSGGDSDAGTQPSPFGSVSAAVAAAQGNAGTTTLLIEEGTYLESVSAGGSLALIGGYYLDYFCRNPKTHVTQIFSSDKGLPALAISPSPSPSPNSRLDGLTLVGRDDPSGEAVGLTVNGAGLLTVADCTISSQANLATASNGSIGVRAMSDTRFERTQISSGTSSNGSYALVTCGGTATVVDSLVSSTDQGAVHHAAITSLTCSGPSEFHLVLTRSRAIITGNGVSNRVIQAGSSATMTMTISGSALACDLCEQVIFTDGANSNVIIDSSTLYAPTGTSFEGIHFQIGGTLSIVDNIIVANLPLGPANVMTSANNIFFGATVDLVGPTGADTIGVYASAHGDMTSAFADPKLLATDNIHLTPASPAINQASQCWQPTDFEGTARPAGACDIGADEF